MQSHTPVTTSAHSPVTRRYLPPQAGNTTWEPPPGVDPRASGGAGRLLAGASRDAQLSVQRNDPGTLYPGGMTTQARYKSRDDDCRRDDDRGGDDDADDDDFFASIYAGQTEQAKPKSRSRSRSRSPPKKTLKEDEEASVAATHDPVFTPLSQL